MAAHAVQHVQRHVGIRLAGPRLQGRRAVQSEVWQQLEAIQRVGAVQDGALCVVSAAGQRYHCTWRTQGTGALDSCRGLSDV
jgi:hypothetical protein